MCLRPISFPLLLGVGLGGDGHTSDRDIPEQDGVHTAGKAQLNRAPHLAAVQSALDKGSHDGAEGADVIEIPAHEIPDPAIQLRIGFLRRFQVTLNLQIGQRLGIAALQRHLGLDINAIPGRVLLDGLHIVADLALQADVGHQSAAGFRVGAGHVADIGITVGIAVLHIKENHKIITLLDGLGHGYFSSFLVYRFWVS